MRRLARWPWIDAALVCAMLITAAWASRVMLGLLDGREVDNPAGYLRKAIRNEPTPRDRFLSGNGAHKPAARTHRDNPAPLGEAIAEMFGRPTREEP